MNKIISGVSAAALLSLSSLAGVAPAVAANDHSKFQKQDEFIGKFCDKKPDNQCNDWKSNHDHWSDNQYKNFYSFHRNDQDFGGSLAAGIFGFALGTMLGGALNEGNESAHVRACENAYRSYDVRTDTYMGFDGMRHRCLR